MNFICFVILFLALSVAIGETVFLFKGKTEPIFFCIKVCPLYCNPRSKRDVDSQYPSTDQYNFDTEDGPWRDTVEVDWPMPIPHYSPYFFCKPQPTTTTTNKPEPTDPPTTEEPSFICQLCRVKCYYPHKTTTTPTPPPPAPYYPYFR